MKDRDQAGIEIALEFVPTITASAPVRQTVQSAFAREGLEVIDYHRPANQLDAEQRNPEWQWARSSLGVHLMSELPVNEVVERVSRGIGVALATVRTRVPELPFGVIFDRQSIRLAFRVDDGPEQMAAAMEQLSPDVAPHRVLGWDRDRRTWVDV